MSVSAHLVGLESDPGSGVESSVDDHLLTVQEAARLLSVSVSWVYEHTRADADDRLPVVKLGKYVRFDRRDLRNYIEAKREAGRGARRR
jgi:excisionase family DNA binding protein